MNLKPMLLGVALFFGLAAPSYADAIVWIMFKNAQGQFKPVEARLQQRAMSMFDCREALNAGAGDMLVRQLSNPENHPDLVGWRVSAVECREARE
ncbi:hypothetical protein [Devosia rhizoryzae]|uniref:Uncharacterized protein n=1 Tax=Devosia rhizoryzae TaxID=2774137 RepID=A0ABX7CC38_9HYPH|nr:hypothetical protein [Devosia rhizoryzae]QQR39521.1 hypothetical protein JI748_00420 [Devosia rhizoryzae]